MSGPVIPIVLVMVYMRCPRCNRTVHNGKQDIKQYALEALPHTRKVCYHCKTPIKLVENEPVGGFPCRSFDIRKLGTDEEPPRRSYQRRVRTRLPTGRAPLHEDPHAWRSRLLSQWPRPAVIAVEEKLT